MNNLTAAIMLGLLTMSISAFGARESKCIMKLKYKVEREGNRLYAWCLDDWDEDGYHFFYTTRRHVVRGVSELECDEIAKNTIGQQSTLKFNSLPPAGFITLVLDRDPYECDGTVIKILKTKYKKIKY